jgi:hypothetical protein
LIKLTIEANLNNLKNSNENFNFDNYEEYIEYNSIKEKEKLLKYISIVKNGNLSKLYNFLKKI